MFNWKHFKSYLRIDIALFLREPMVLFFAFAFPVFMYIIFGLMFRTSSFGSDGSSYYDEYTGSFLGLILLNVALFNIGPGLVIYKERGFFRRLLVTPLSMNVVLVATLMRSTIIFAVGLVEMLIVGWLLFNRVPPQFPVQILLALSVSAYALFSFGFMFGSFFRSSGAVFGASILTFQMFLMLSGASIPMEQLPGFVQGLSKAVPFTHVVDLVRLAWKGRLYTEAAIQPAVACAIMGTIFALVAVRLFRWSAK